MASPESAIGTFQTRLDEAGPEEDPHRSRRPRNLAPAVRASLNAKLERLLQRPLIARIPDSEDDSANDADSQPVPSVFLALQRAARAFEAETTSAHPICVWRHHPEDGSCSVPIAIDYDDLWRGHEKEVKETVTSTVESSVTFLTEQQKLLLERSPREFLALEPRPESAELLSFETEIVGGSVRVVELTVAAAPESPAHIRYVAVVPNLVQIERQLDGLYTIEAATDDGPLAPLRVLLGIAEASCLPSHPTEVREDAGAEPGELLDEYQLDCIRKAMTTPHFAVIQGPPGSGKTTVITGIIRRALDRGQRVLVVSPTHVAVDNVVEKLTPRDGDGRDDLLDKMSLPVRYSARTKKLSGRAQEYWVGRKRQRRAATIADRIQRRLVRSIPFAEKLFATMAKHASGAGPLSSAVAGVGAVICGTPIGILSFEPVEYAAPGSFDLLIVDEVSKMTMPEFLAIAVKARRWVLVGDPEQLPPFNNSEENAATLDGVLDPILELACSVGAVLERARPAVRRDERLVVVSSDPRRAAVAIQSHVDAVMPGDLPRIALVEEAGAREIVLCSPDQVDTACESVSASRGRDLTHNPDGHGSLRLLVERGVRVARPELGSGRRLLEPRMRAQALIFENSFNVYHAQPWIVRTGQKLRLVTFRNALDKYLPSGAALDALGGPDGADEPSLLRRARLIDGIAERFALNTISVYDWLTGIPAEDFDASPLRELGMFAREELREAVRPFVGTLKKQYRMHSSLSLLPRSLFYFDAALHDGRADDEGGCRVSLLQVEGDRDDKESNRREVEAICSLLEGLNSDEASRARRPSIMVITPYRLQEALLEGTIDRLRSERAIANLDVKVCTLDRCQGRESEYVFLSLVRGRATPFLDMPKRWNVALTRAMQGLFIVGNVDAYLREAKAARHDLRALAKASDGQPRLLMSLLARIIEAYDRQITESQRPRGLRVA